MKKVLTALVATLLFGALISVPTRSVKYLV